MAALVVFNTIDHLFFTYFICGSHIFLFTLHMKITNYKKTIL